MALVCMVWLTGCGFADPGTGTQVLLVQGSLNCDFATLTTQVTMVVQGTPLAAGGANIVLTDADTHEGLQVPVTETLYQYAATWPGYHRRVRVQVTAGSETVSAAVEGPGQHTLLRPHAGATLSATGALDVAWASDDGIRADTVDVTLGAGGARHALAFDSAHDRFLTHELSVGRNTVTVRRSQSVAPAGAAAGSKITSSYSVSAPYVRG